MDFPRTSTKRSHTFAIAASLATLGSCVMSPSWQFENQIIRASIGKPFPNRLVESMGPPISVEVTKQGSQIYAYAYHYYYFDRSAGDCTVFYEVKEDAIIAAWQKGSDCVLLY